MALLVTTGIVFLLPVKFQEHIAEITEKSSNKVPKLTLFEDINGDGFSDRITAGYYENDALYLTIYYQPSLVVEEYNFRGNIDFTLLSYIIPGDYDEDGHKEIYIFTISNDSLFLHWVNSHSPEKLVLKDRFITKLGLHNGKPHLNVVRGEMDDLNRDGKKELIFALTSGLGKYPRGVYAYDIVRDSLVCTTRIGYHITKLLQYDLNNDGIREIIPEGYASCNYKDTFYPYNDTLSWLMVLDNELNFLFPPVGFPGKFSAVYPFVTCTKTKGPALFALINPPGGEPPNARLCRFNLKGEIIKECQIDCAMNSDVLNLVLLGDSDDPHICVPLRNGNVQVYDSSLSLIKEKRVDFKLSNNVNQNRFDLDGDDDLEIVIPRLEKKQIVITESDLSDPVIVDVDFQGGDKYYFSLKRNGAEKPELAVFGGNSLTLIRYDVNSLYKYRWFIYAAIYFTLLAFIFIIRKIQRLQIEKKLKIEKKINELQLKIVRNQLDPHFALNAVNSAIDAINNNKSSDAGQHLFHFSQMFRSLVLSSDSIKRPLKEEIEFTENYVKMEQFRFKDKFLFELQIEPQVDINCEVPKMIIQSHVENAVKHGLAAKKEGMGKLFIHITQTNDACLTIEIRDNGPGLHNTGEKTSASTGKGLEIMNNLYELFYKITNRRITAEITEIVDEAGHPAGTLVKVVIPLK